MELKAMAIAATVGAVSYGPVGRILPAIGIQTIVEQRKYKVPLDFAKDGPLRSMQSTSVTFPSPRLYH
jgi:hypothetical protein